MYNFLLDIVLTLSPPPRQGSRSVGERKRECGEMTAYILGLKLKVSKFKTAQVVKVFDRNILFLNMEQSKFQLVCS